MASGIVRYRIDVAYVTASRQWVASRYNPSLPQKRLLLEPQPDTQLARRAVMAELRRWFGLKTELAVHFGAIEEVESVEYYRCVLSPADEHGYYVSEQEGAPGEGGAPVWKPIELSWLPLYEYAKEAALKWAEQHLHQGSVVVIQCEAAKLPKPANPIKKVEFET